METHGLILHGSKTEQRYTVISTCMSVYSVLIMIFKYGILRHFLFIQIHEWQVGTDKVKSKLEIDPATQMDAGVYECTADNMYSIDRRSFKTDFSIAFD